MTALWGLLISKIGITPSLKSTEARAEEAMKISLEEKKD
jgi:hypothetical protein